MAVSMRQMAEAYINQVKEQIKQGQSNLAQVQKYVMELEKHLTECQEICSRYDKETNSSVETVELPNPFDQLKS